MNITPVILAFIMSVLSACGAPQSEPWELSSQTDTSVSATNVTSENTTEKVEKDNMAMNKLKITVGNKSFSAILEDNETANAFKEMLPLTLGMSELNGNEKYYYLDDSLPSESEVPDKINTGDIMLYSSECLVVFYKSFSTSYSYTTIGHIEDTDGFAKALGNGNVTVTFELQ